MMGKIDFQDNYHGSHLGFRIGMILAIFDLQAALILPTKIGSIGFSVQEKKPKIDFHDGHGFPNEKSVVNKSKAIKIFCSFGPAKILQSDNRREFVTKVINEIANQWPGLVIIHGHDRHPQSGMH